MKMGNIVLTLSNGETLTLEGTLWGRFLNDLNNDKSYIEQNIVEPDGSGDTFLVMKNQIIMAKISYKEN